MRRAALLWGMALVVAVATAAAARDLPILSGRWSRADCRHPTAETTRFFAAGTTSSANDACSLAVVTAADNIFHAHLTCRYRAARPDQDDVVLKVNSPTSLDWIDECTSTAYRLCTMGARP